MRYCFYHTDLRQNAVFHNFAIQIGLTHIQDHRGTRGLLARPFLKKKNFNITYTASRFSLFAVRAVASVSTNINRVKLQHNKECIMFIFFLFKRFIDV